MQNQNEYSNAHGKGKEKLRSIFHVWEKYNPLLALARNGFLLGVKKLNLFGLATRMYPAFLTPAEAQSKHIKVSSIEPAKRALDKLRAWYEKVGGKSSALDSAIQKGSRHRIKKISKKTGADGLIEWSIENYPQFFEYYKTEHYSNVVGTMAAVTAGMTLLASALHLINGSGVDKNPFEAGSDAANQFDKDHANAGTPPADDPAAQAALEKAAQEDKDKGLGLDDGSNMLLYFGGGVALLALVGLGIWYYKTHKTSN